MTVNPHLVQRSMSDAAPTPGDPWWLQGGDFRLDWKIRRSGSFPTRRDQALIDKETPDA